MDFKNWKTTLFGALMVIFGFVGPVLQEYFPVRGLNWSMLFGALATTMGGTGLLLAKDSTTHSTPEQVKAAGAEVTPEAKAKTEQAVGKAAVDEVKKL